MSDDPSFDQWRRWLAELSQRCYTRATRVPLEQVAGWRSGPAEPEIRHHTGRFFRVGGLVARLDGVVAWQQPVVHQPDVGVLALVVARRGGVPEALVQAKPEPGNINGLQLAPTVQATYSNYTRAHGGRAVPYLELFLPHPAGVVLVDSRQSEHGSVFFRKRNRNVVVEVATPPPARDGFAWLPLAELYRLLAVDDLVSMDLRTVLSCLAWQVPTPVGGPDQASAAPDAFAAALRRSADPAAPARHRLPEILHWLTDQRCRHRVEVEQVPLPQLAGWRYHDGTLVADGGPSAGPFRVIGVTVTAAGREVGDWAQPMLETPGTGLLALLVSRVDGVLYLLLRRWVEPGLVDVAELGPTVHEPPHGASSGAGEDAAAARLAALARAAAGPALRFDAVHSEEGGRFFHTRHRHRIVEIAYEEAPPGYRWLSVHQVRELLRHSHYLNIAARSLLSCLYSLMVPAPAPEARQ